MTPTSSLSPKIKDVVVSILHTLKSIDHAHLTKSEIQRLGVSVDIFALNDEDSSDKDSLDPETQWLFKPISKEDIKTWKISPSEAKAVQSSLEIPDLVHVSQHRPDWDVTGATQEVPDFITAQFDFRRKSKTRLRDTFGWSDIDSLAAMWDSFFSMDGKYRGVDTPGWRTCLIEDWWDGEDLAGPSVRLIICTDRNGKEGSLLQSELGSIAQVVAFRRNQPGFETYRLFPVLLISLFGPRHGRIIQACYDRRSNKFGLRISRVFCFVTKEDAAFDTFFRFTASYPPQITNPHFARSLHDREALIEI
ncbi:hypothetical protein N7519_000065 [Penicillium mononematosum]|uniref:uncharacterized protein n=1 Tax=Penicillium mononematosum TaxID=268346 RepID=UPI002546EFAA|nr:uncharacterized protein N7519_000065 [Penicillium mononematosum]KAJ6190044.1 hypothetical protein N7519_000065 [Penicillium mononematosum]